LLLVTVQTSIQLGYLKSPLAILTGGLRYPIGETEKYDRVIPPRNLALCPKL